MHFGPLVKKPTKPQPPPEIKKPPASSLYQAPYPPPNMYMNFPPPNPQHLPPNSYPMGMQPPERHSMPPNMMGNPQFKNYPPMHAMNPMMMKPPGQRPPQGYPPGIAPPQHPQYLHPQIPPNPNQINPNMNPMVPPNMIPPQGQQIPPQVNMNNPNYQQHLNLRRASTLENPHIKIESMNDQQSQMIALNMRKKSQQMNPLPPPLNTVQSLNQFPNGQAPTGNNGNQNNSPGNQSPSNSQNQLIGSNNKDQGNSKSKPSELNTLGLTINNHKITGYDIVTKIFFGKKQIVWELNEAGHGEKKEQSLETPSKEKDEEGGDQAGEEGANENMKKKFDIRFNDIESVEVNVEKGTMTIDTKTSPIESKVMSQHQKKTVPWVKHTGLLKTTDGKPIFEPEKPTKIVVLFQKDLLTRKNSSKNSHLDKIRACQLNLTVIGQISENPTPKNKPSMSPTVSMSNDPKLEDFASNNNSNSRYMMNSNMNPGYDDSSRHIPGEQNPQIISLSMYNPQNLNNNKGGMGQFTDKSVKVEPLNEKREDEYDMNEEGEMFPILTKERIIEIKRFENEIKTKPDEDKVNLAINSLKIKRHSVSFFHKKYRCPYYKCYKSLNNPHSLKSHLVKKHPRLLEMGLNVNPQSETKIFDWNAQMIDNALIFAKTYPRFAKNIIREMKKRKNSNY